jgi:hypothetical protein
MPGASINGIVSALMIWKQMVPEDREFLPLYLKPGSGSARDVRLWTDYVKSPAVHVFANVFPDLVARDRVASLFQYSELIHE